MAGLTNDETAFVVGVSKSTGIDPRVLVAWEEQEGAYAQGGTGGHNYLNLRPEKGDPYVRISSGGFEQFASVQDAITATVHRLREPFAAPILAAAKRQPTPRQEIGAIASTGWDAGHYGGAGGPNLQKEFAGIFTPAALDDRYLSPANARAVASTAKTGSAADAGSFDATNVPAAVGSAISGLVDPLGIGGLIKWIGNSENWYRIGLFVLGIGGIGLGAFITFRT